MLTNQNSSRRKNKNNFKNISRRKESKTVGQTFQDVNNKNNFKNISRRKESKNDI